MAHDGTDADAPEEMEPGAHRPGDSVFDAFTPSDDLWAIGADGLPEPLDNEQRDAPLSLTPENLVCMAQSTVPKCAYYKRQLVPLAQNSSDRVIERWCCHKSLRGLNGAALNLSDSAMFACELRDPPHEVSAKLLDAADEQKMAAAAQRGKNWRMFATPEEAAAGTTTLGENDYEDKNVGI